MPIPTMLSDGNHTRELLVSQERTFPFAGRGDGFSFEYTLKYQVDKDSFYRQGLMSVKVFRPGRAYLVDHSPVRDIGKGIVEFERIYASVPRTRTEYTTIAYTQQYYNLTPEIFDVTFTMPGWYVYEYFTTRPEPLIKPRVYIVGNVLKSIGGAPSSSGTRIAEDSEVGIYKAGIFYRRTPYVNVIEGSPVA